MSELRPPIIVDGGSELLLFRSVETAERYMEPIDVMNGEYRAAYDSQGQLLEPQVERTPASHLFGLVPGVSERVKLCPVPEEGRRPVELARSVRAYLERLGAPAPADGDSLEALLAQLRARAGFTG